MTRIDGPQPPRPARVDPASQPSAGGAGATSPAATPTSAGSPAVALEASRLPSAGSGDDVAAAAAKADAAQLNAALQSLYSAYLQQLPPGLALADEPPPSAATQGGTTPAERDTPNTGGGVGVHATAGADTEAKGQAHTSANPTTGVRSSETVDKSAAAQLGSGQSLLPAAAGAASDPNKGAATPVAASAPPIADANLPGNTGLGSAGTATPVGGAATPTQTQSTVGAGSPGTTGSELGARPPAGAPSSGESLAAAAATRPAQGATPGASPAVADPNGVPRPTASGAGAGMGSDSGSSQGGPPTQSALPSGRGDDLVNGPGPVRPDNAQPGATQPAFSSITDGHSSTPIWAEGLTAAGAPGSAPPGPAGPAGVTASPTPGPAPAGTAVSAETNLGVGNEGQHAGLLLGPLGSLAAEVMTVDHVLRMQSAGASLVGDAAAAALARAQSRAERTEAVGTQAALDAADAVLRSAHTAVSATGSAGGESRLAQVELAVSQAQHGAARAAQLLQAALATSQPVLAQVWADLYAVQQARLDRLTALRAMDEEGRAPPADEDERIMRERRIGGVAWGSMHRRAAPDSEALPTDPPPLPVRPAFRAAMLSAAMQTPQELLRMFAASNGPALAGGASRLHQAQVRLHVRNLMARQHARLVARATPVAIDPEAQGSWLAAAEGAFAASEAAQLAVRAKAPDDDVANLLCQCFEAIYGQRAHIWPLHTDAAGRLQQVWLAACRANAPLYTPLVAYTSAHDGGESGQFCAVLGAQMQGEVQQVQVAWVDEQATTPRMPDWGSVQHLDVAQFCGVVRQLVYCKVEPAALRPLA